MATEKVKSSLAPSQPDSQAGKKATWEISLNQKRQKAAQSFPSMVAVPELVLYKVCRLYFSTLLPFTTKLKSGIINLRAAREAPGFIGGMDDLPRFPGDPSFVGEEFYLPRNLMPTEMQMRIGFHRSRSPCCRIRAMRDRVLTILSAFHAIEELAQAEEDAARFTDESSSDKSQGNSGGTRASSAEETELNEEDIRKRTALVADMSAWKPKEASGAVVIPDKSRIYSYGFLEKPKGSHRLRKPAQRWLDEFFYAIVQTLRVWSPAGDVFDGECFEFKESFFRKYPTWSTARSCAPRTAGGGHEARIPSAYDRPAPAHSCSCSLLTVGLACPSARPQLPVLLFVLHSLLASLHLPLSPFRILFCLSHVVPLLGLIDAWTQASSRSPPSAFVTLVSVVSFFPILLCRPNSHDPVA